MPSVPDDVAARAVTAWTGLFGTVNFELFGQFDYTIANRTDYFDHSMTCLGRLLGFPA